MWTFIVVFVLLTAGHRAQEYDNDLKGVLFHVCSTNHAISQIKSSYSPTDKDRQWKIECKPYDTLTYCSWSADFSSHKQELSYNCPHNYVVTGVYSRYMSEGRRWSFLCCSAHKFVTFECLETPKVNYWNEDFNWHVPGGNFLTGVHTHNKSDRPNSFKDLGGCRYSERLASMGEYLSLVRSGGQPQCCALSQGMDNTDVFDRGEKRDTCRKPTPTREEHAIF